MGLLVSTPQEREESSGKMADRVSMADMLVSSTVSVPQQQSQKDSSDFLVSC